MALLVYVGLIEFVAATVTISLSGAALVLVSVALAVVPATIWLSLFYAADRLHPEPRTYVMGVALLGAALALAGEAVINQFYGVEHWLGRDILTTLLGLVLVVGFVQTFMVYAALRFTIYNSGQFDERVDGVIYGTAAGLGYATMVNVARVVSSGGVNLGVGVISIVVVALIDGALGGLIGYFLGRDKFDRMPVWWMPVGLVVTATMNGLFAWLQGQVTSVGLVLSSSGESSGGYNPWLALLLASVLAAGLVSILFLLIQADLRADLRSRMNSLEEA